MTSPDATSALAGLNEAQRHAVELVGGPVLVIAGAGSGKTRTLVHRVAHLVELGQRPSSILLLTFTRRAAGEMLARARQMRPEASAVAGGTFHSLCHRVLRRFGRHLDLPPSFTVLDQADSEQLVRGVLSEKNLAPKKGGDKSFPKARSIAGLWSRARNLELGLGEALDQLAPHLTAYEEPMAKAIAGYTEAKRTQGLVDYDDLLFLTEELLRANREVRGELARQWRHLLVDEYQDTNAVQARLLGLLAQEARSIMVVGDDSQSIYRFRGARFRNILDFPQQFPGTRLVKLEQNYRSTQPILDLTNAIIAGAAEKYDKHLFTEQGQGPRPELLRPRDERGQSREVVGRIHGLLAKGASPDDVAVLFRAGRDSYDLERELTAEGLNFVKYGGLRFLEAAHIKDVLSHLRVAANPQDYLSWQRLLMLLPGVGPKTAQQVIAHLATGPPESALARLAEAPALKRVYELGRLLDLFDVLSDPSTPPVEMVAAAMDYYEPICKAAHEDWPRRLRDLEELPELARAHERLDEFLAETTLDPPAAYAEEQQGGRVTLSTIHSAKGMEWPHVFVIWAAEGRLPAGPSLMDPEALEEERRLMYVACTRAARSLAILSPRESWDRGAGGLRFNEQSRFLDDLPAGVLEAPSAGPVFPVEAPAAAPASRGAFSQDRPFQVGAAVRHATFGQGKVMGYKGAAKILVHFQKYGLKILSVAHANLEQG